MHSLRPSQVQGFARSHHVLAAIHSRRHICIHHLSALIHPECCTLCSIRAPRLRPGGAAEPEPFAREAKEALRKAAIGAKVSARLEYSRKVVAGGQAAAAGDAPEPVTMQFGNAAVAGKGKDGPAELAELLVRRGLAAVQARSLRRVEAARVPLPVATVTLVERATPKCA